jgi:hypothetical protein
METIDDECYEKAIDFMTRAKVSSSFWTPFSSLLNRTAVGSLLRSLHSL